MRDGMFPDDLKIGRISPIYEKDDEELLKQQASFYTSSVWENL
jgi:hypothetical protein